MKNNFMTIFKKECSRIISDRRLFITTVLLPGLMIFIVYNFMGVFMGNLFMVEEDYVYEVHVVNLPSSIGAKLSEPNLRLNLLPATEHDAPRIRQLIENQETDLLVVFPVGFDDLIADFEPVPGGPLAPNVEIWSNSARSESFEARHIVNSLIANYHHNLTHRFTINAPSPDAPYGVYDLVTDADVFAMVLGMIMPMIILIFLFSASMSLAPESIAGEKERGTLAGMLVTPASRRDIALGKIGGIAFFCMLSAFGSILGMMLALPNMIGFGDGFGFGAIFEWYGAVDILFLLLVAASTSLVFVSVLSILSAFSKTVKEATAYASPIMIVVMLMGFASAVFGEIPDGVHFYMIPVVNSSLSFSSIISFETSTVNLAVTAASNTVFAILAAFVLAKMFGSERIIFDK